MGLEDTFGFPLPTLTDQQTRDRTKTLQKWQAFLEQWDKYARRRRLPRKSKLKDLIRQGGVPPEQRTWVWMEISGAQALKADKPDSYFNSLLLAGESNRAALHQIELDLPRTFPEHKWLHSTEGQVALRRVLVAYASHNTRAGYCQGLNFVAGTLLLATNRDSETAFWLLTALLDRILYRDMYGPYLPGFMIEMKALDHLVRDKLPTLHKHLDRAGCEITFVATDWFMCLYTTTLPHEVSAWVWDCLFSEGAKILFRVALALLKLHQNLLMQHDNTGELLPPLKEAVSGWWSANRLLKMAFGGIGGFGGIGSLPMRRIEGCREEHRGPIEAMAGEREKVQRLAEQREAAKQAEKETNGGGLTVQNGHRLLESAG